MARWAGQVSDGKALLETDRLVFRGTFRLAIPLASIKSAEAKNGDLLVKFPEGLASFELGRAAEKWLRKIQNPPDRADKLGIKPGLRIALVEMNDTGFRDEVVKRGGAIVGKAGKELDSIFVGAEKKADLDKVRLTKSLLKPNGAVWIVYPKGVPQITEQQVLDAGRKIGLTDVKVASFSKTHTALKFVIPLAQRG
jgi:hypothetical protein